MDEAILVSCYQKRKFATHVVHWHRHISFSNLIQCGGAVPSPELDSSIPSTTYHYRYIVIRENEACHVLNWLSVRTNILDLIRLQVPLANIVVSASQQDRGTINLPAKTQNWNINFLCGDRLHLYLWHSIVVVLQFPSVYCAIPPSCH